MAELLVWNASEKTLWQHFDFRTISGNPRQFNYRDESVGLCVSAQNITTKIYFLYLLILVFVFGRKRVRSALKIKSILCYNINVIESMNQKENGDAAVT